MDTRLLGEEFVTLLVIMDPRGNTPLFLAAIADSTIAFARQV